LSPRLAATSVTVEVPGAFDRSHERNWKLGCVAPYCNRCCGFGRCDPQDVGMAAMLDGDERATYKQGTPRRSRRNLERLVSSLC
jgi:hypothetical protein